MADLLVLYHSTNQETFLAEPANRILHDGLRRAGLSYALSQIGTAISPAAHGALLVWWFRLSKLKMSRRETLAFENAVATRCEAEGVPLINQSRGVGSHSYCLEAWRDAGIPCGRSQRFKTFEELALPYPMILRVDGGSHSSKDSFFVDNQLQAQQIIKQRRNESRPNLNLAITFIDTRYPDGFYRKWRTIVVGDRLVMDDVLVAPHWCVKMKDSVGNQVSHEANHRFLEQGPEDPLLLLRAARALKQDILALDYSIKPNGEHIFWEANRRSGVIDFEDEQATADYRALVGRSLAQNINVQVELGNALAELVGKRINQRSSHP